MSAHQLLTEQPGWQRLDQAEHDAEAEHTATCRSLDKKMTEARTGAERADVAEERTRAQWRWEHVRSDLRRQRADHLASEGEALLGAMRERDAELIAVARGLVAELAAADPVRRLLAAAAEADQLSATYAKVTGTRGVVPGAAPTRVLGRHDLVALALRGAGLLPDRATAPAVEARFEPHQTAGGDYLAQQERPMPAACRVDRSPAPAVELEMRRALPDYVVRRATVLDDDDDLTDPR